MFVYLYISYELFSLVRFYNQASSCIVDFATLDCVHIDDLIAYLTFQLHFSFRVFNKVKSRSAHMKSHRPIPLPDSTGQESKRPTQQSSKAQQPMLLQQNQQQQQQQSDNATPQIQDHQQQLPASISDNSQNTAHLCRNPTRPP